MNQIHILDAELTRVFKEFQSVASELRPEFVCGLADEEKISKQNYPGLYLIEVHTDSKNIDVKEWISALRLEWEQPEYLRSFTANFKERRIRQHMVLLDWMPLYIGKSKNVGKRVLEHLNLGLEKSTFAMKIKARPKISERKFRLSTLPLPVKNYDIIAPALESALRDRLNPLIGKQ